VKRALLARLLGALVAFFAIAFAGGARADGRPEVHVSADTDVIGLGDTLHVTLEATSSGTSPVDPELSNTNGFQITGISPSSSTSMSIMNGAVTSRRGLTTVWSLRATKVGVFTLGPPTVVVDGTRYRAQAVNVRVVPAGQAPQRAPRQQQQPDPFDPFGGLFGQLNQQLNQQFGQPFGQMPDPRQQMESQLDPRYALSAPRGQTAFLHATIDKSSLVIGEQVTYTVYLYVDVAAGRTPELNDPHEAPASDFVKRSLQADESKVEVVGYTNVGGQVYAVQLLRRSALFPLKSGDLDIGEMTLQVAAKNGLRRSEDLRVRVSEPPIQGRPAGYAVGDVGTFALSADVSGRDVDQDGAIGVTVTLSGNGNIPSSIDPPEHAGVEWLDPQVTEKLGRQSGDKFGGTRTFQYVVRLHTAGDVDLGDFTLPYWDPHTNAYATARAALGTVHVKADPNAKAPVDAVVDPLPGLPGVRTTREPAAAPRRHLDDTPAYWLGLGGMPLAYGLVVTAAGAMRRVREKRAARSASPKTEMQARVAAADAAASTGDSGAIDAATAHAIEAATIACAGVNVRGLATSDVARALRDAGVAEDDGREIESVLLACEAARFSASDARGTDEARERWGRARRAIDRLAGRA
jgi:hypothetical protein